MDINELWAKTNPWESLPHHMKAVGDVAVRLITDSAYDGLLKDLCRWSGLTEENVVTVVRYLAAMHDIGKAHPSFQSKNGQPLPKGYEDETVSRFRHEKAVLDIAIDVWSDWDRRTRNAMASVLSLHHQHRNQTCVRPQNPKWVSVQSEIENEIREWAGFTGISINSFKNVDAFCTILTALIILSDWIASSQDVERAFDGLSLRHYDKLQPFDFQEMFGCTPRNSQQAIIDCFSKRDEMPLLTVIEAPPGEGKTEIAIWLAHKIGEYWNKKGIYFALPTAATSNQMVGRVRDFLHDDVSLLHSTAWLENLKDGLSSEERTVRDEWKRSQNQALLSRYAVGTIDQVMLSVLKVKYGVLRLLGLTNKVVIIDEIHAYDAYMTEIIERLVEWLFELRIPMILLSATLPMERKQKLLGINDSIQSYPLITSIFEDGRSEQISAGEAYRHMSAEIEVIKGFDNITMPPGMNCILVNTVEKAQEIYKKINGPKMLFHGRYTAKRRKEIEDEVVRLFSKKGKRGNMTLVATQVVEQSLDVDFDYLVTELAPIDLIIQRIGRLHRFDIPGRDKPKCTIFYEGGNGRKYGKSEFVYYPLLLERTARCLTNRQTIVIPNDIREMIESVYSNDVEDELVEEFLSRNQEIAIQQSEADVKTLKSPSHTAFCLSSEYMIFDDDEMVARTRLGAGYKLCIIPKALYDKVIPLMDSGIPKSLAKEINEYCIPTIKNYDGVDGKGRLAGCRLRIGTADSPTETTYSTGYKDKLVFDKELGLCSM